MLSEDGGIPFFRRNHAVGQTGNVFPGDFGNVESSQHRRSSRIGTAGSPEVACYMMKSQRMDSSEAVVQVTRRIPVGVLRLAALISLFAAHSVVVVFAQQL